MRMGLVSDLLCTICIVLSMHISFFPSQFGSARAVHWGVVVATFFKKNLESFWFVGLENRWSEEMIITAHSINPKSSPA